MESARHMRALDPKLPAKAGQNQQRLRGAKNDPESLSDQGSPLGRRPFFRAGCSKVMSWAQQREAIRIAAEAGVRARTSAAGSKTLPCRPPPSRQYDRNQPLIREGPNDYIVLRGGAKKLLRSLQPNGNNKLTKLGKHFFKDKWVDGWRTCPSSFAASGETAGTAACPTSAPSACPSRTSTSHCPGRAKGSRTPGTSRRPCSLGNPEPNDIILELSDETYYLDATREWTFSQQAMQVVDD